MKGNLQDISSDGGGMAGPRLLESVEEVSEVLVPMAHGETGDSNIVSIPFQVVGFAGYVFVISLCDYRIKMLLRSTILTGGQRMILDWLIKSNMFCVERMDLFEDQISFD